jgi:hypothetical protein
MKTRTLLLISICGLVVFSSAPPVDAGSVIFAPNNTGASISTGQCCYDIASNGVNSYTIYPDQQTASNTFTAYPVQIIRPQIGQFVALGVTKGNAFYSDSRCPASSNIIRGGIFSNWTWYVDGSEYGIYCAFSYGTEGLAGNYPARTYTVWIDKRNRVSPPDGPNDCFIVELGHGSTLMQRWGFDQWCTGATGGGLEVADSCPQGTPDCDGANHNWASHRRVGETYKLSSDPPGGSGWRAWNYTNTNYNNPYVPNAWNDGVCTYYQGQPVC